MDDNAWSHWRPHRRLRHLRSIEGRNIAIAVPHDLDTSACYFTAWQYIEDASLRWVYTSEEVCGGTAPQWSRLHQDILTEVEDDSLHRPLPGLLHIHLYLVHGTAAANASQRPATSGPPHPTVGSTAECRHTLESRRSQLSLLGLTAGGDEPSSGSRLHDSCADVALRGRLLMSASLDLDALEPLAAAADLDGRVLPPNTLIIELSNGLYVWPPSQHLQRTASGAMPAAQPAAAPAEARGDDGAAAAPGTPPPSAWGSPQVLKGRSGSRGAQQRLFRETPPTPEPPPARASHARSDSREHSEPVSRSSSASRLTDGQVDADRRSSLRGASTSGSDEVQVAVGNLEWSLMSIYSTHQQLQAARAKQQRLLKTLNEAVERRTAARQQAAALQSVRHRLARQVAATQRAQQAAAMFQRSMAVSRQIATLQARALLGAANAMQEAGRRLQEAARLLEVEGRGSRLHHLQRQLVARRCRMAVALGRIYSVGPRTVTEPEPPPGGFLWDQLDDLWFTEFVLTKAHEQPQPEEASELERPPSPAPSEHGSFTSSISRFREVARLAVGGLELEPDLARRAADPDGGWRVGHVEAERAAAALGYVARLTQRLAHLLDVPLRYPLRFANSRSSVFSHALPAGTFGERGVGAEGKEGTSRMFDLLQIGDRTPDLEDASLAPKEFPLFLDGSERMRFRYAVFLLNKDIEQLLNAHGLHSTGINQLLQNLYKLLAAAASAAPSNSSGRAPSM
ncbi:hypothetical protein WJX75_005884 [Coccomyxa subellipsoidea]|uniref:UV radiation resistance-associated gene protein n=1 Tax=Coccomyxa subellipsoidea TaxID=248742 RepID=A0ABR2YW82_9CHLO